LLERHYHDDGASVMVVYDAKSGTTQLFEEACHALNSDQFYKITPLKKDRRSGNKEYGLCCRDLHKEFKLLPLRITQNEKKNNFEQWFFSRAEAPSCKANCTYHADRYGVFSSWLYDSEKIQSLNGEDFRAFRMKSGCIEGLEIDHLKAIADKSPESVLPFYTCPEQEDHAEHEEQGFSYAVFFSKNMFVTLTEDDQARRKSILWRNEVTHVEPLHSIRLPDRDDFHAVKKTFSIEISPRGDYVAFFDKKNIYLCSVDEYEGGVRLTHRLNLPCGANFLKFSGDSIVFVGYDSDESRDVYFGPGVHVGNIKSLIAAYEQTIESGYEMSNAHYIHANVNRNWRIEGQRFREAYEAFFVQSVPIDKEITSLSEQLAKVRQREVELHRLDGTMYNTPKTNEYRKLKETIENERKNIEGEHIRLQNILTCKQQQLARLEDESLAARAEQQRATAEQEFQRLYNIKERVDVVRRYKKLIDEKSTPIGFKIALAMGIAPVVDDLRRDDRQCEKRLPIGEHFIHKCAKVSIRTRIALEEVAQQRRIEGFLNSFSPMARHLLHQQIRAQQSITRS
jgi:hypothetical protein